MDVEPWASKANKSWQSVCMPKGYTPLFVEDIPILEDLPVFETSEQESDRSSDIKG